MHDALPMDDGEAGGCLSYDLLGSFGREQAITSERVGGGAAADQLHCQVIAAVVPAEVIRRHHMHAVDACRRPSLAEEPFGYGEGLLDRTHQLDRHPATQHLVGRAIDLPHPAPAEHLTEPVSTG